MNPVECPNCGGISVEIKSTMMERNFAMCYVTYYECAKCGHVWEPKRFLDLPLGNGEYVKIPDGAYLIVEFPDGERWRKKLTYLDSHHFTLDNGHTWHVGQFRELMEENPGTKVSYEEIVASPNARNKSAGGKKVSEKPAFFSKWRRD